jgi:hypothetical protein
MISFEKLEYNSHAPTNASISKKMDTRCAIPIIHPHAMKARFRQHLRNSFLSIIMANGLAKYADALTLKGNLKCRSLPFFRFNGDCTIMPLYNA